MASIPLPALDLKQQEQPDIASQLGRVAQLRSLGQQQQIQQQQIQEGQQKLAQTQALNDSFKNALTTDPQGNPTFDRNKVIQSVSAAGQGSLVPKLNQSFMEMDKLAGEVQKTKDDHNAAAVDYLGAAAKTIKDSGYDPKVAGSVFAHAAAAGYGPEVGQLMQQLNPDPSKLPTVIDSVISSSKTQSENTKNVLQGQDAASNVQLHQAQLPGAIAESGQKQAVAAGTSPTGITAEQQAQLAQGSQRTAIEQGNLNVSRGRLGEEKRHNLIQEGGPISQIPPGVNGDDALKLMDPQRAAAVKMIGDGKVDFSTMAARMPPAARINLAADVHTYNPDFSQQTYSITKGMGKYMTSGEGGKNLTAFNTAIDHAGQLDKAVDALNNGNVRALNAVGNTLGYQFGSDKTTNFNVIKNALSGEVSKVFKGGQATDAEIHAVQAPFDAANSPQQLKGAIKQAIYLMNSKRDALKQQYESGEQGKPNFGTSPAPQAAAPMSATGPNGHKIVVQNGRWVDAQTGAPVQ